MTDRELDRQVAEQLFGFVPSVAPSGAAYGYEGFKAVPAYSTNPAAMVQVVEKMLELRYEVCITGLLDIPNCWRVSFNQPGKLGMMDEVDDPSLGRAVCLAVLAALAREEETR